MLLGSEYFGASVRVATVIVPVAGYFFILGLLNTRRRPQILTGRLDFSLLMLALCPGFVLPMLERFGLTPAGTVAAMGVLAAGVWMFGPGGRRWVVYNLSPGQADRVLRGAMDALGWQYRVTADGYCVEEHDVSLRVNCFWILHNVSVHLTGGSGELCRNFARELGAAVARTSARTQAMAVAMLLVAMGMLVAPLAMVAHRVPEIVRLLVDFW
ncbi:MAG: hypothetical protein ISS69_09320 [Phycisphaerae bacterium]|nr:hypothetical protein [Planctomycetota bacterium]MBL7220300.1 hypothetical protein [Phycisphaerae bacterium]